MVGIGISACSVCVSLTGSHTTSGSINVSQQGNDTVVERVPQARHGNKIGHDPLLPKIFTPPKEHSRPDSIRELVHWFNGSNMEARLYKLFYYHKNVVNNVSRFIRSEFREMISMGCAILTHYYDVVSEELGFRDEKGKWVRLSYQFLAKRLGVSLNRVKRFFKFLRARGLVSIIYDQKRDEKGNWKSNISRKYLKASFFIETLGMKAWQKVQGLKEWILKKRKAVTKKEKKNSGMITSLVRSILSSPLKSPLNSGLSISKKLSTTAKPSQANNKQLINLALEMHRKDPSKSCGEYMKILVGTS